MSHGHDETQPSAMPGLGNQVWNWSESSETSSYLSHTEGAVFTFQPRSAAVFRREREGGVAGQAIPGGTTRVRLAAPVGGSTRPLVARPTALTLIMAKIKNMIFLTLGYYKKSVTKIMYVGQFNKSFLFHKFTQEDSLGLCNIL